MNRKTIVLKLRQSQIDLLKKYDDKDIVYQLNHQVKDNLIMRLMTYRIENGLSQKALAEKLNVERGSIINWENNKHDLQCDTRELIEKFLGKVGY